MSKGTEGRGVYAGLGMQEPLAAKCKVLTQKHERKHTQVYVLTLHPRLMAHPLNHPRDGQAPQP